MARTRHPLHSLPAVVTAMNLNGLGVARVLGRHGVPVIGVHDGGPVPELASRYVRECWRVEPGSEPLLRELRARGRQRRGDRPVLIPITDEAVRVVAENLDELQRCYRIGMPEAERTLWLLSKKGIAAALEPLASDAADAAGVADRSGGSGSAGAIRAPRTWVVDDADAMDALGPGLPFPVVLKPQLRSPAFVDAVGHKAVVLDDAASLLAAYRGFCARDPHVVLQQHVPGGAEQHFFCLMCIAADGATLGWFTGRKLRTWPVECGGITLGEPVDAPQLVEASVELFRRVGMTGLCSTEFKRDPRDGAFYLLEPTVGRPDWQNAMADHHGAPLAYRMYCDLAGLPVERVEAGRTRPRRRRRRWLHLGPDRLAAAQLRARGELGRLRWLWSIRPPVRAAYWAWDDPAPFLRIFGSTLRRGLRKLTRAWGGRRGGAGEHPTQAHDRD